MLEIVPSVLSANFANLERDIKEVELAGIKMLHLDVMDGHFVPNITFGPGLVRSIRAITPLQLDVHLMIEEPLKYIDDFASAGADLISFHLESRSDAQSTISKIKENNVKAGIAINPDTSWELLLPYLEQLDFILIMSVFPGFAGQSFMPEVLQKAAHLKRLFDEKSLDSLLQIDGGINGLTIFEAAEYGIDLFVAGSSVFNNKPIIDNISDLKLAAGNKASC